MDLVTAPPDDPGREVLRALQAVAPASDVGERIRRDRGSQLVHLGVPTPRRRAVVAAGFSFTTSHVGDTLGAWDAVWRTSDVADVLFAALDHYRVALPRQHQPEFWPVARQWIDRIENWAHADDLGRVYSWAMHHAPGDVYPTVSEWSRRDHGWYRRVALVSTVHYTGRNAVFLPVSRMLDIVENCLDDTRPTVRKAIGWVLREAADAEPDAVAAFVAAHPEGLSATTRRALHRSLGVSDD
jgi:3-methyladenine DNA glycosylase AlkD